MIMDELGLEIKQEKLSNFLVEAWGGTQPQSKDYYPVVWGLGARNIVQ